MSTPTHTAARIGAELLTACFLVFSCLSKEVSEKPEPTPSPSPDTPALTLDRHALTLTEGTTDTLQVSLLNWPDSLSQIVSWRSSDSRIASVKGRGIVSGRSIGSAFIYATAEQYRDSCLVSVKQKPIPAVSVSLEAYAYSLRTGESVQIKASVTPSITTDSLSYSSQKSDVASVDANGLVTAIGAGKTTIEVRAGEAFTECEIQVLGSGVSVMLTDPLYKVYEGAVFPESGTVVRVAAGEVAAVQLVIDPGDEALSDISVEFSPMPSLSPEVYLEQEVLATGYWPEYAFGRPDDELMSLTNRYPDPMFPIEEKGLSSLAARQRAVLMAEYWIPRGYSAGEYKLSAHIKAKGGAVDVSKEFTVKVYPVSLPEKQGLMICNWTIGDYSAMNGGEGVEAYSARYYELQKVIVKFMERYGQNVWHSNDMPSLLAPSWPYLKMDKDGNKDFVFDFSVMDEEMNFYIDNCTDLREFHAPDLSHHNETGGGNYKTVAYIYDEEAEKEGGEWVDNADGSKTYKPNGTRWPKGGGFYFSDPGAQKYLSSYFKQRTAYLKSKTLPDGRTWLDIYRQGFAEEGNDGWADSWNDFVGLIKKAAPELKFIEPIASDKIDRNLLDEPVVGLGTFDKIKPKDHDQWMYTGVIPGGPYANRFIRMPLIKTRLLHWIDYRYKHVGYLHWGMKYWQGAENGDPYTADAVNGDSYIVYPGYGKIYPSVRLCAMRDGIRDFDLLKLVEAKSPSKAEEFCEEMVQDYGSYNTDIDHFRDLRRRILEYLSE